MKKLEKLFDILGEIIAVVMVVLYVVALINAQWPFIPKGSFFDSAMKIMLTYGALLLVAVVGLEAISKRNLIFRIIFYALLAVIIIFMFFPATYTQLIGLIK
jgi:hypothetical protein